MSLTDGQNKKQISVGRICRISIAFIPYFVMLSIAWVICGIGWTRDYIVLAAKAGWEDGGAPKLRKRDG